jgi:hypothetical protein
MKDILQSTGNDNEDMGFEDREGYQAVNSWNR